MGGTNGAGEQGDRVEGGSQGRASPFRPPGLSCYRLGRLSVRCGGGHAPPSLSRNWPRVRHSNFMFEQTFKNIDDVLWKEAGCTTELDYTEQTSWILFLKYLDDLEHERALTAELHGKPYSYIIDPPHRWSKWAAPKTKARRFRP